MVKKRGIAKLVIIVVLLSIVLAAAYFFLLPTTSDRSDTTIAAEADERGIIIYEYFDEFEDGYVYDEEAPGELEDFFVSGDGEIRLEALAGSNQALLLDGSDGDIAISSKIASQSGTMTAEVKFNQPVPGNATVLELRGDSSTLGAFVIEEGSLFYRSGSAEENETVSLEEQIDSERWYIVKVVATPSDEADIYLNERLIETISLTHQETAIDQVAVSVESSLLYLDDLVVGEGQVDVAVGFNTRESLITGGMGGDVVVVDNREDFLNYMTREEPYILLVEGHIDLGGDGEMVLPTSNKTFLGLGDDAMITTTGLRLDGVENVIIRNITFYDQWDDSIEIRNGSKDIWIDHNTFRRADDGSIDTRNETANAVISWNRFVDTEKTLGVGAGGEPEHAPMLLTYHHNSFERARSRNPSISHAYAHVYNNYFTDVGTYGIRSLEGEVLAESNFFRNTLRPIEVYNDVTGKIVERDNIFENSGSPMSLGTVFEPWEWYTYHVDPADQLEEIVPEWAGAGKIKTKYFESLLESN